MVERVAERFGLAGTSPTPDGQFWGNVQTTAADLASLLGQSLADPVIAPVLGPDMLAATAIAADGVDQRIGMRSVPGAGSKQGWGCCLSGVIGIHSMGFTDTRIVVVLSSAEPDDYSLGRAGWAGAAGRPGRAGVDRRGQRDGPRGIGWAGSSDTCRSSQAGAPMI